MHFPSINEIQIPALALIACLGVTFSSCIARSVFNKVDVYGNVNDSTSGDLEVKLEHIWNVATLISDLFVQFLFLEIFLKCVKEVM